MAKLDIINLVYGEEYTRYFVDISLPSQLSAGNIPSLRERAESVYHIYTTVTDFPLIEASPALRLLSSLIKVNVVLITADEFRDPEYRAQKNINVYNVLIDAHRHALNNTYNDHIMILSPDIIISDGSLRNIEQRLDEGYEAVMTLAPRADKGKTLPQFQAMVTGNGDLTVSSRTLVDILIQHPHSVTQALMHPVDWEVDVVTSWWPSIFIWQHPQIGLVCHSPHLHPIAIKRSAGNENFSGTIDNDYLMKFEPGSEKIYFPSSSDEILLIECSSVSYESVPMLTPPVGIYFIARWFYQHVKPINFWFTTKPMVFLSSDSDSSALIEFIQKTIDRVNSLLSIVSFIFGKTEDRVQD